jgi:hypothetical protein
LSQIIRLDDFVGGKRFKLCQQRRRLTKKGFALIKVARYIELSNRRKFVFNSKKSWSFNHSHFWACASSVCIVLKKKCTHSLKIGILGVREQRFPARGVFYFAAETRGNCIVRLVFNDETDGNVNSHLNKMNVSSHNIKLILKQKGKGNNRAENNYCCFSSEGEEFVQY